MNRRQQNKYIKRNIPCAHEERFQETEWSGITSLCKVSRNGEDFCKFCKRYAPKYGIKYTK